MSLYCSIGSVDTELTPKQLNDLLARLDASFEEMNNYAAKVASRIA